MSPPHGKKTKFPSPLRKSFRKGCSRTHNESSFKCPTFRLRHDSLLSRRRDHAFLHLSTVFPCSFFNVAPERVRKINDDNNDNKFYFILRIRFRFMLNTKRNQTANRFTENTTENFYYPKELIRNR